MRFLTCLTMVVLATASSGTVLAQQVTIQQPAFRQFSATTTVSVPDRGAAFLAGVGRAADSRSNFGPFRSTTSTGTERAHAGMSVGAWIHDFEEMDRALLGQSPSARGVRTGPLLTGYVAHSYRSLHARNVGDDTSRRSRSTPPEPDPAAKADRFYRLGLQAEERGSAGVARLHYRAAIRNGSLLARERLQRLDSSQGAGR